MFNKLPEIADLIPGFKFKLSVRFNGKGGYFNSLGVLHILDEISEPVQLIRCYFIFAEKHDFQITDFVLRLKV